ncbi:Mn2+/Zn2+ ABC transporter permease [Staphylococcus gallinarum]|uniref:Mn2+/Zn2+ ABC transporter permease n=1 Tax=Staphylococcus gallinarum TaxID=1293 RepID=A0A380FF08_STAGA|nr:Mn2+/Zn2+ ABC transporter permease [Staphylococcus gallinarum]
MDFIQHLFDYLFLRNALIISIVVGIVCGTVGCLIVLRGLSLMGDAMSHAVLPGVALSFFFQNSYVYRCLSHRYDCQYLYWIHH